MSYTSLPDQLLKENRIDIDAKATAIHYEAVRKTVITGVGIEVTDTIAGSPVVTIAGLENYTYDLPTGKGAYYIRFEPMVLKPKQAITVSVSTAADANTGDLTSFQLFGAVHPPSKSDGVTIIER